MQTLSVDDAPLCLHSWKIFFTHPLTKERVKFSAPLPDWAGNSCLMTYCRETNGLPLV